MSVSIATSNMLPLILAVNEVGVPSLSDIVRSSPTTAYLLIHQITPPTILLTTQVLDHHLTRYPSLVLTLAL